MNNAKPKISFLDLSYTASFMLKFSVIAFLSFMGLGLILFQILNRKLSGGYFYQIATLSDLQEHLTVIFFVTTLGQAMVLCLVVLVLAFLWAHAIAGPLVRFQKFLVLKPHAPQPGSFRVTDQLAPLAVALNHWHTKHTARIQLISKLLDEAEMLRDEYQKRMADKGMDKLESMRRREELRTVYTDVKKALDIKEEN